MIAWIFEEGGNDVIGEGPRIDKASIQVDKRPQPKF